MVAGCIDIQRCCDIEVRGPPAEAAGGSQSRSWRSRYSSSLIRFHFEIRAWLTQAVDSSNLRVGAGLPIRC